MPAAQFVTVYNIECPQCKDWSGAIRVLQAKWPYPGTDCATAREEVISQVLKEAQVEPIAPPEISVRAILPATLADEPWFSLYTPLPSARAKVVLSRRYASQRELDACFELEVRLEAALEGDIGFVDGNEVGQGKFRIFCYGPKKGPLKERILELLEGQPDWKVR